MRRGVLHGAMGALQFPAPRDGFQLFQHGAIGAAGGTREDGIVGAGRGGFKLLQHGDQLARDRDFPLLPVLRVKPPVWLCRNADTGVTEVDIAPCDGAALGVTESGHQVKLEAHFLMRGARLEQGRQLGVLVDRADGFDEARPVGRGQQFGTSVLLEQLAEDHQLVVDRLAVLPGLRAKRGEVHQRGAVYLVDVGVRAEFPERAQGRAVVAEGPQGAVIADVVLVFAEGVLDGDARGMLDLLRGVYDTGPHGRQLGLLLARALRCHERIRPNGLMRAHAGVPPLQEMHALGVKLVAAPDGDMVAAHPALAVEQRGGEDPVVVVLDFLEKLDATHSRHVKVSLRRRWLRIACCGARRVQD
ncbi:MAG: hypothetical protein DMG69_15510 [Acidobacteria bacterium]|nr:MAG: hypothetical protein DMG69_15510 [Acidobacteriota bacterium]